MGAQEAVEHVHDGVADVRDRTKREAHRPSAIVVFVGAYAVFAAARLLIRVDRAWYERLERPPWVISPLAQEVIWFAMFGVLAMSAVYVFRNAGGTRRGHWVFAVRVLHYLALQSFIVAMFYRHDLLLSSVSASLLVVFALLAAVIAARATDKGAKLLVTYGVWALYNCACVWALYALNGR